MTRTINVQVPGYLSEPRRVERSGAERLAEQHRKVRDCAAKIIDGLRKIDEGNAKVRGFITAFNVLYRPSPEQIAARDRAALNQSQRNTVERQRQQLADTQAAADKFYGRTGR